MDIYGGRKYGLWHLTSPPLPRRTSLDANVYTYSSYHKTRQRTKSNGDIDKCWFNEENRSATFESKKHVLLLNNVRSQQNSPGATKINNSSKFDQSVRRSVSDYSTNLALATTNTPGLDFKQRFQLKEKDEERTPLLVGATVDVDRIQIQKAGYGGKRDRHSLPFHAFTQARQSVVIPNSNPIETKRDYVQRNQKKYSVEQSVFIEEDDDREAKDTFQPLPHGKKIPAKIWTRFSQKNRKRVNVTHTNSVPADTVYRPLARANRLQQIEQKISITSSNCVTQTPTSSRFVPSPETGRSVTRCATTIDADTLDKFSQRVHANRCELYTNRAILICILSGFVLFFVGSISFVAYILAEKSYSEEFSESSSSDE